VGDGKAQHDGKEDHEGHDQPAQRLDDGGVTEEGEDALNEHGGDDEDHLGRASRRDPGLDHEHQADADNQDQALHLESDLGYPVEERDRPRAVRSERRPVAAEDRRPRVRPLQRAQAKEEVGQIAQHDHDEHLGERETERHQDGAVNEVLDLHAHPGPHAEDVPWGGPPLTLGDEVDPMLFDPERIIDIRLVNDGQILGNRHRQYLLLVASAEARPPPKGDRRTG
jgi:hypothetical protein